MLDFVCNCDKQHSSCDIADNTIFVVKEYFWRKGRVVHLIKGRVE